MLENIQIFINNIHIRYEDDRDPFSTFSCGVSIESVTVQSTNDQFKIDEERKKADKIVYKVSEYYLFQIEYIFKAKFKCVE